jgi:hypothetical protein
MENSALAAKPLKVNVLTNGRILLDGRPLELAELSHLLGHTEKGAMVWYREKPVANLRP